MNGGYPREEHLIDPEEQAVALRRRMSYCEVHLSGLHLHFDRLGLLASVRPAKQ